MDLKDQFIAEAKRCLNCSNTPCMVACPAHNPIPRFMQALKNGQFLDAKFRWEPTSDLPEICGRLCQNELLCEGHCTLNKVGKPMKIGWLEAGVADLFLGEGPTPAPKNGKRHLVVGLGPSGIANALRMAERGYAVTAYDANPDLGGALQNMIPEFRFDPRVLDGIRQKFTKLGIVFHLSTHVGRDVSLSELLPKFDSTYIACGADLPQTADLETDGLPVFYAHDLLNRARYSTLDLDRMLGHYVLVVGLGNVAVDMARVLVRLGKQVTIIYRRSIVEAPAGKKEITAAVFEGIEIVEFLLPKSLRHENGIRYLDCGRTVPICDAQGNRIGVEPIPGSGLTFRADDVIFATGQKPDDSVFAGTEITLQPGRSVYATNDLSVFVGGDRINKNKRIVDAMVSGLAVADLIEGARP